MCEAQTMMQATIVQRRQTADASAKGRFNSKIALTIDDIIRMAPGCANHSGSVPYRARIRVPWHLICWVSVIGYYVQLFNIGGGDQTCYVQSG